jgi:hypothetical protein
MRVTLVGGGIFPSWSVLSELTQVPVDVSKWMRSQEDAVSLPSQHTIKRFQLPALLLCPLEEALRELILILRFRQDCVIRTAGHHKAPYRLMCMTTMRVSVS